MEVKEQNEVEIPNRCAVLESMYTKVNVSRAAESI
jgi:hypothetical protein